MCFLTNPAGCCRRFLSAGIRYEIRIRKDLLYHTRQGTILVKSLEQPHAQKRAAWLCCGQGTLFLHGIGRRWGQGKRHGS